MGRISISGSTRPVGRMNLLHDHAGRLGEFVRARRRRNVDHLIDAVLELFKRERPVIERAGKTESVGNQHLFAGAVAVIHAVQLRDGLMALVDKHDGILRQVIEKSGRGLTGKPSLKSAGNNSRCRGNIRSLSSFRDRTWCADEASGLRSACPVLRAADATPPVRP